MKRLLTLINSYSFNLYYIKGKDMVLSDFKTVMIVILMRLYLYLSICIKYYNKIIVK